MGNTTSKVEKNKKRIKSLRLAISGLFLLALVSIICGIFVTGISDPKDYYGTYYGFDSSDYCIYVVEINEDGYKLTCNNGIFELENHSGKYSYGKASRVLVSSENDYSNKFALKLNATSDGLEYYSFLIDETEPYSFTMDPERSAIKFTNQEISFANVVNDPMNYYGAEYKCTSNTNLSLGFDGKAVFKLNGTSTTYNYKYVSREWLNENVSGKSYQNNAFVLYGNYKSDGIKVFEVNGDKLIYSGETFRRTKAGTTINNNTSTSVDPKDYYGTYYSDDNYMYMKFEIKDTGKIKLTLSTGYSDFDAWGESNSSTSLELSEVGFTYRNKEQAAFLYPDKANNRACLDLNSTVILWIESSDPYTFKTDYNGTELTIDSNQGSVKTAVSDPENYYKSYDYYYSAYNYKRVRFYSDGSATLYDSGTSTTENYNYIYVNKGWLEAWGMYETYSYDRALIIYNDDNIEVFQYIDSHTLQDTDEYSYYDSEYLGTMFESAMQIEYNETKSVVIDTAGEYVYFKFVPTATKSYTISSQGSRDTYGYLYNSSTELIKSDDDSGNDLNFSITYTLNAGRTYYIVAKMCYSSATGTFTIKIA